MALLDIDPKSWRAGPVRAPDAGSDAPLVIVRPAQFERLLPAWRGLADQALAANPFMAPEFITPAAMNLAGADRICLAAAWKTHRSSRELIGLFALSTERPRSMGVFQGRSASLWSHRLLPLAPILLSRDERLAREAASALIAALSEDDLRRLLMQGVETGGKVESAISRAAAERGLAIVCADGRRSTRGLDVMLTHGSPATAVVVAREPEELRAMLEQALAMDAGVQRRPGTPQPALFDVAELGFMRAVVRGFAQTGQIVMARLNDGGLKAAALAVLGEDRAFLWRMFGPSFDDPKAEAALAAAINAATGLPVAAAAAEPLSGFCAAPLATRTLTLALQPAAKLAFM